jgi:hypothetical protein
MAETTLRDALDTAGPYAVWELMTEDEQRLAATALWKDADRDVRIVLEAALAKELKFRPHSLRKLPVEKVAARLVRMAPTLPDTVAFQFLFYLHMKERRPLMVRFLDAVEVPHEDGVLDLPEDFAGVDDAVAEKAATELVDAEGHEALVYLATLLVADAELWAGIEPVLKLYSETGEKL